MTKRKSSPLITFDELVDKIRAQKRDDARDGQAAKRKTARELGVVVGQLSQ